eukprot:6488906-Amphidinium_carterae.1
MGTRSQEPIHKESVLSNGLRTRPVAEIVLTECELLGRWTLDTVFEVCNIPLCPPVTGLSLDHISCWDKLTTCTRSFTARISKYPGIFFENDQQLVHVLDVRTVSSVERVGRRVYTKRACHSVAWVHDKSCAACLYSAWLSTTIPPQVHDVRPLMAS